MGEMGVDNFGCLNSFFCFYFHFIMNLQKNICVISMLTSEPLPSSIRASTLLAGPPIGGAKHIYFMDEPFTSCQIDNAYYKFTVKIINKTNKN